MNDDLDMFPREEAFDPSGVMLFKAMQMLAFLFFIALLSIAPDAKDGKIDPKAEFLITMSWPDNHPDDLDLFVLGVTRSRWPWTLKAGAIVLTSAFYVLVFFRTQGLLGWSATAALPARFEVLWARTVEPDPASNDPGAVHLWLETLDEANRPSGEPRAYRLPYTRRLAQKVEAARTEIQADHPQGGRAVDLGTAGDQGTPPDGPAAAPGAGAEAGGDPASGGSLDPAFLGGDARSVEFAPLPRPTLPPKDAP